jgi:hypothetical protein
MNNTEYQLNQPKQRRPLLYTLALLLGLLLNSFLANADEELEVAKLDNHERIKRLQDLSMNTEGWYMTMPTMQSSSSRTGLQTAGYSALHEDMLEAMNDLADDASKELALNRLENIRDRVENRIMANLDAGYLYAAGVYIDMLEDIAPGDNEVTLFRQQVTDRKAFKAFVEKFDAALADNRLQSPASDCASHYLEQMRQLQHVDAEKLTAVENRFKHRQQLAMNG